jgi:hypothetical protein
MSKVYQPNGVFTDEFNDLHDQLRKAIDSIVEMRIKPFIVSQKVECMDIRLINAELRDLVDLHMDLLWLDCLTDFRDQEGQS